MRYIRILLHILLDRVNSVINTTNSNDSSGTYVYTDTGGEQTIVTLTTSTRKIIYGVWVDLVNMTKDGTIKGYCKIDGTNYRLFTTQYFIVATDSDGIYLDISAGVTNDIKFTYEEDSDEGAARNIPYSIIYENKE